MARRTNGAGTLIKKPNGTYIGKWYFRGKLFMKAIHETDRAKALKVLDKLTKPYTEESDIDALMMAEAKVRAATLKVEQRKAKENDISIAELAKVYLALPETSDIADTTKETMRTSLSRLTKWLIAKYPATNTVSKVNARIAAEFIQHLAATYAGSTFNGSLVIYKKCWGVLSDGGKLFDNPWARFKLKKLTHWSNRRELTSDEIVRLIECARNDEERLLFVLGIYTGMRIGDCCTLQWTQVDMGRGLLTFVPHKTRNIRSTPVTLPIHPILMKGLVAAKVWKKDEYVMPDMHRRYALGTIRKVVDAVFKRAGIAISSHEDCEGRSKVVTGFHALRKTFVSINVNSGMNPFLIQHIVGHSAIDMTAYYYAVNRDLMRRGMERMPDFTKPLDNAPVIDVDEIKRKESEEIDKMIDEVFGDTLKQTLLTLQLSCATIWPSSTKRQGGLSQMAKSKSKKKLTKKAYHIVLFNPEQGFYAGSLKFTQSYEEAKVYKTSLDAYKTQKTLGDEVKLVMLKEVVYRIGQPEGDDEEIADKADE